MIAVLDRAGDPDVLSHEQCLELLESIEVERAALDAVQQRALAALHRRDPSEKGWTADEVACVLRVSPRTAPGILHDARTLVDRFPAPWTCWRTRRSACGMLVRWSMRPARWTTQSPTRWRPVSCVGPSVPR